MCVVVDFYPEADCSLNVRPPLLLEERGSLLAPDGFLFMVVMTSDVSMLIRVCCWIRKNIRVGDGEKPEFVVGK